MTDLLPYLANIAAICLLVFGVYLPRHHRRDLAVAYLGVNIGVMAVSIALVGTAVTAGLGLGLFGVLSIIRLRSDELAQHEMAYYFSALALGLLGGLSVGGWKPLALMALVVAVLAIADHPRFTRGMRRQIVVLDRAVTDDVALTSALEQSLGGTVLGSTVQRVDFVNDTTLVEVRWSARASMGVSGSLDSSVTR